MDQPQLAWDAALLVEHRHDGLAFVQGSAQFAPHLPGFDRGRGENDQELCTVVERVVDGLVPVGTDGNVPYIHPYRDALLLEVARQLKNKPLIFAGVADEHVIGRGSLWTHVVRVSPPCGNELFHPLQSICRGIPQIRLEGPR